MKSGNDSLSEKDTEDLKDRVDTIIMKPSHNDFIRTMLAVVNQNNLRSMYQGFQSTPKSDQDAGLVTRMWNKSGTLQTPWFQEEYNEQFYKVDKKYKAILEFPKDLAEDVGSGALRQKPGRRMVGMKRSRSKGFPRI